MDKEYCTDCKEEVEPDIEVSYIDTPVGSHKEVYVYCPICEKCLDVDRVWREGR